LDSTKLDSKNVYFFNGQALISELNNYSDLTMYIGKKSTNKFFVTINSFFNFNVNERNRYKTGMSEFDKYYEVKCSNNEKAKQLLNSEIIDIMLQYTKETVEYAFLENKLYIFINKGKDQFKSTIIRNPLSFERIYEYYLSSQGPLELMEKLLRSIK